MIQVSEAFDYGIGNPEYFVRSGMTEEEADIANQKTKQRGGRLATKNA